MKIAVLPGEGIGPEVTECAIMVLKALPLKLDFEYGDIGYEAFKKTGEALPAKTIELIKNTDAALFGAVTTPPNIPGYFSPILKLRQYFDLYVNLRPVKSIPNKISREKINMYIVRENTEGLYSGSERTENNGNKAITEMIISRKGSQRVIRYAFELARKKRMNRVTVVHKGNVLRETCGLFLRVAQEISKEYQDIEMNDLLVDNCAMQLIKNPSQFQVIVTTNMFGDILSDEASMLVGGLGIAHSGNIGEKCVFEPVHGSAPKYARKGIANPIAAILSAKLMLETLGYEEYADKMEKAVIKTIKEGHVTRDLGGSLSTSQATDKIIENLR